MSYHNGDPVIENCYFCDLRFSEPQKLGDPIHCQDPNGYGCGMQYMIKVAKLRPAPRKPEPELQNE